MNDKRCAIMLYIIIHLAGNLNSGMLLFKQLRVEGFIVKRWLSEWPTAFKEMSQWIKEVYIVYLNIILNTYNVPLLHVYTFLYIQCSRLHKV